MSNYEKENSSLQGLLWKLSPEEQRRLIACHSSHRFMSFKGKVLVIYTLIGDRPKVYDRLTCEGLSMSFTDGISSTWKSQKSDKTLVIGHLPFEVAPNCFVRHTMHSAIDFVAYKGIYSTRCSLVYHTLHNPDVNRSECLYMQELASYQAEFQA